MLKTVTQKASKKTSAKRNQVQKLEVWATKKTKSLRDIKIILYVRKLITQKNVKLTC